MKRIGCWLVLGVWISVLGWGAAFTFRPLPAGDLDLALQRLLVLGRVLYIGAHPDDENTALLAYLVRYRLYDTAYLSITRGAGGQNLLGRERGPWLSVLRTQELLAARAVDGARQFFTRAVDFGYSKSPEETLRIWGETEILADLVRILRWFRPDIVITRFPEKGRGHGHHTASAILARKAFEAAGDPARFPDAGPPWRPRRLFWNAWPRASLDSRPVVRQNLGVYSARLGFSIPEIAARARSMHRSQGFGAAGQRGPRWERLVWMTGEPLRADSTDPMEGIDTSWRRVAGGQAVEVELERAMAAFRPDRPWEVLPGLLAAWRAMDTFPPDAPWISSKREELRAVIGSAAGLWLEAVGDTWIGVPGEPLTVRFQAVVRTPVDVRWVSVTLLRSDRGKPLMTRSVQQPLIPNKPVTLGHTLVLPNDMPVTMPYWLRKPPTAGRYHIPNPRYLLQPEDPPPLVATFRLQFGEGPVIDFPVPVVYRWVDPVEGERYRRVEVAPPVVIRLDVPLIVFPDSSPRPVNVEIQALRSPRMGTLQVALPPGWRVESSTLPFHLDQGRDTTPVTLTVYPPPTPATGTFKATAVVGGKRWSHTIQTITYPHIPIQTFFPPAQVKLVRMSLRRGNERIGYVMGSGDEIPDLLRQIGYAVTLLSDEDLARADLNRWDVIITGVRAYNTRPALKYYGSRLLAFVRNGGTLIVQYNTNRHLVTDRIGPYPFRISRVRVTDERAPVTFLRPDHPLLHVPNLITPADFEGWVQERGLYFADMWDTHYETVLACADPGEPLRPGGLLYARYGRGVFIYTGYAWFRQLPAGVPGAFRLFVNLISAGRSP